MAGRPPLDRADRRGRGAARLGCLGTLNGAMRVQRIERASASRRKEHASPALEVAVAGVSASSLLPTTPLETVRAHTYTFIKKGVPSENSTRRARNLIAIGTGHQI